MFPRSLRWRIQLWHTFLLSGIMLLLVLGFFGYERQARLHAIDLRLGDAITPLLPELTRRPPPRRGEGPQQGPPGAPWPPPPREDQPFPVEGFGPPEPRGPRESRPRMTEQVVHWGLYYVAWAPDGRISAQAANAPPNVPIPEALADGPMRGSRNRGGFREFYHQVPNGFCVLVGTSTAAVHAGLSRLTFYLTAAALGIVAVGFAGGWLATGYALQPITQISATAEQIATGDLSRRIDSQDTGSELGRLIAVLNSTFHQLEAVFAQQARFTSDAAHELRTPVTVLLTQTQSALSRERSAQEYRESLQACQRAAQRMRRLITALLELARLDTGQEGLKRERFDLADIVRDCLEMAEPIAAERNIVVRSELESVPCLGDPDKIAQVVTNLLINAVYYNRPGGDVRVTTASAESKPVVIVTDTGQGIAADDLPHIFERFYRADKARSGAKSCSGLGLAICKSIVDLHGGRIDVASRVGVGSTFTLRLPALPSEHFPANFAPDLIADPVRAAIGNQ